MERHLRTPPAAAPKPLFNHTVDGTRQLRATVRALRRPESYPEAVGAIEAIETHMSWVFLTDQHAYKLKKPIETPLLDHTTLEARRLACRREVELNRRLAPDVYLDVVPVVASYDGSMRVEGPGTVVDWLVKMRRLPRDRMLDACIARRSVRGAEVDRLALTLTGFYAAAERQPLTPSAMRGRILWDVEAKRRSLEEPRYDLRREDVRAVVAQLRGFLDRQADLLEARAAKVVDAHGDLRPEHVCLEPVPVIIDCLEFSRDLRLLDPISELAFLALECRRLGAAWIGEQLIAEYLQKSGDDAPASQLVPFYQSYHALVRAAIAVWHLDDETLDHSEIWREKATWYLHAARQVS